MVKITLPNADVPKAVHYIEDIFGAKFPMLEKFLDGAKVSRGITYEKTTATETLVIDIDFI